MIFRKENYKLNSFIKNTYLSGNLYKDIFPYYIVKCFGKMIASEKKILGINAKLHTYHNTSYIN